MNAQVALAVSPDTRYMATVAYDVHRRLTSILVFHCESLDPYMRFETHVQAYTWWVGACGWWCSCTSRLAASRALVIMGDTDACALVLLRTTTVNFLDFFMINCMVSRSSSVCFFLSAVGAFYPSSCRSGAAIQANILL